MCPMVGVAAMPSSSPTPDVTLVLVEWQSRTAGFHNSNVATIIQKACAHFKLGNIHNQYTLVGDIEGREFELTDDALKLLPHGSVVTLTRLPDAGKDDDDLESVASDDTYRSAMKPPSGQPYLGQPPVQSYTTFDPFGMRTATPYAFSQPQQPFTFKSPPLTTPPSYATPPSCLIPPYASVPSMMATPGGWPSALPSSAGPSANINGNQLDREIQVLIATPSGRTVPVFIRLSETIRTLKSKIQDKENVPVDQQRLHFGGYPLADGNTLAQCNIPPTSTILLSCTPFRTSVKMENLHSF